MQACLEFYVVTGTQSWATMLIEPASLPTEPSPGVMVEVRGRPASKPSTVFRGAEPPPPPGSASQNSSVLAQRPWGGASLKQSTLSSWHQVEAMLVTAMNVRETLHQRGIRRPQRLDPWRRHHPEPVFLSYLGTVHFSVCTCTGIFS